MNFEAMHAITNCIDLTSNQRLFLLVLCMNSKRDNYDPATDTIKNIKISNLTIMKKMGCSKPTVYRLAAFFKKNGILVNLKENEEAANHYTMIIASIKTLKQYPKKVKKLSIGVSHRDEGVSHRDPGGIIVRQEGITERPNHIINNNIYNNNYKGCYFFKNKVKIQSLDHARQLLDEKLDSLMANNELPIKYKKEDLLIEVEFHLTDWLHDLAKGLNIALDLILKAEWDIPLKLRSQRNTEAIERERAAQLEKKQELEDMRSTSNVAIPQILRMIEMTKRLN